MSGFIQKETTKDIVIKFTSSNYFPSSNDSLHIVFACSGTVRTVSHLQNRQQIISRKESSICRRLDFKRIVIDTKSEGQEIDDVSRIQTSNNFGWKLVSSMTSTPYIALDIGLCISGCTFAAASKTDRIIFLTLE